MESKRSHDDTGNDEGEVYGINGGRGRKEGLERERVKKVPRSSVINIRRTGENVSYADTLRKARQEISLNKLGIEKTKIRYSSTGNVLIEVYGENNKKKADDLAEKIFMVVNGDARVTRPIRQGNIRVVRFDESVSVEEIAAALAIIGECLNKDMSVGRIYISRNGLSVVTVRCPLAIAIKICNAERVKIGWTVVKVDLLRALPMRCYKCLETGHVSVRCKSAMDRSDICYRCSDRGYIAANCIQTPFCILCVEKGKEANHRIGNTACERV